MRNKSQEFGKIYPLIEELDNSLSDIPHAKRIYMMAELVISYLSNTEPFKLMENPIDCNHSFAGLKKYHMLWQHQKKI